MIMWMRELLPQPLAPMTIQFSPGFTVQERLSRMVWSRLWRMLVTWMMGEGIGKSLKEKG